MNKERQLLKERIQFCLEYPIALYIGGKVLKEVLYDFHMKRGELLLAFLERPFYFTYRLIRGDNRV